MWFCYVIFGLSINPKNYLKTENCTRKKASYAKFHKAKCKGLQFNRQSKKKLTMLNYIQYLFKQRDFKTHSNQILRAYTMCTL